MSTTASYATALTPSTPNSSSMSRSPYSGSTHSRQTVTAPQPQQSRQQPSTPQQPATPKQTPTTAPQVPGTWRHPRMDEITFRLNAGNFDNSNAWKVFINLLCILGTFIVPGSVNRFAPSTVSNAFAPFQPYPHYTLLAIRLFFCLVIALELRPLLKAKDMLEDIPLTPQQRHLLGLPASSRPATPDSYVTPPRYQRSATPRSTSNSPLSGRGSSLNPSQQRSSSDSPFGQWYRRSSGSPYGASYRQSGGSPYSQSPLVQKALSNESGKRRTSSPLSLSEFEDAGKIGTPTKSSKASVQLNSKWLYEKGRGSPGGRGGFL